MLTEELVEAEVTYGMGASCKAVLERRRIAGMSARNLIAAVTDTAQPSDPARRAAAVLKDVLLRRRDIDVEVSRNNNGSETDGQPVAMDDIVVQAEGGATPITDKIAIQVSEPYVGG